MASLYERGNSLKPHGRDIVRIAVVIAFKHAREYQLISGSRTDFSSLLDSDP
jgi:hypothetical protein